jgi:RNA polymerase sigma-70 factor (sigma-E family)
MKEPEIAAPGWPFGHVRPGGPRFPKSCRCPHPSAAGLRPRPASLTVSGPVRSSPMTSTEPDPDPPRSGRVPAQPDPDPPGPAGVPAEPDPGPARSKDVADPPLAGTGAGSAWARSATHADLALTEIYETEYRSLVRMSTMLLGDIGSAEEVVQDCFIAMHAAWYGLREADKALHYLRRSVVNRSRSVLRHRIVVDRHTPKHEPDMPSAEQAAITQLERSAVISALGTLPVRQREALVLKFFMDLSEEQVASVMNISRGAVKSHTARGKAALRSVLEPER